MNLLIVMLMATLIMYVFLVLGLRYIYIYYSTVSLRQRIVSYSLPSWLDGSRHWNMWMFEPWSSSGESEVLNSSGHWMMSSISLEDFFQQICNIHHIFKNNIVDMIVEVVNGMKEDSSGGQWCGKYHIHFLFHFLDLSPT